MSRLELHRKLEEFYKNVYFQPPSNIKLEYPCIVYNADGYDTRYGGNGVYIERKKYYITVMELEPEGLVPKSIRDSFLYCTIETQFTMNNLYHTRLSLYY